MKSLLYKVRSIGVFAMLMLLGAGIGQAQEPASNDLASGGEANAAAAAPGAGQQQLPRVVRFNGVLQDGAGASLTGVQGVTFALYAEQQDGAPLWLETQAVEADAQGRYTVLLGSMRSDGLPQDVFTSNEARWLGVQVSQPGVEEQARVLLVSVPYALKAADAETLGGKPVTAFVLAPTSDSGDGATKNGLPTASASADGLPAAAVTTAGMIPKYDVDNTTLTNSVMSESSNNIGIGTTSPAAVLHVRFGAQNALFRIDNGGGQTFVDFDRPSGEWRLNNSNLVAGYSDEATTKRWQINGAGNTFFTGGNFGIGRTNPVAALDVQFNLQSSIFRLSNGGGQTFVDFDRLSGEWRLNNSNLVAGYSDEAVTKKWLLNSAGASFFNGGNVGIGTATPATKLEVSGGDVMVSGGGNGYIFPDASKQTTATSVNTNIRGINYIAGCDNCAILADPTDDQKTIYQNVVGLMNIAEVTCFADTGSPTINLKRDDGSPANILTGALACNGTPNSTFSGTENQLSAGHKIDFDLVSASTAHRVTVVIKAVVQ
jgi:hypothetical protein